MEAQVAFDISVLMGLVVWGLIGARYIWPPLRLRPRPEALRPLLLLHAFRYVGLAFLVPGVVSPDLPDAFARPAAYGDVATSVLALFGIATLGSRLGTIIVWVFNIVGTVDLLNAFYQADRLGVGIAPGLQGAAYFIPTVLVPLLIVTHVIVFRILLRAGAANSRRGVHSGSALSTPFELLKTRRLARRLWPTHCSRLRPARLRGCATSLDDKRSRSHPCGDFFPQECSNKECGGASHWTGVNEKPCGPAI